MSFFSGKKFFLLGFILVLLVAIPLTVFLTQKRQQVTSQATPATTLSFVPTSANASTGQTINFDVMMNPATNQVSFVKLIINYDATKLTKGDAGITPNTTAFPSVLEGPTYTSGSMSVTLSVGGDPAKVIQTATKVATVSFKVLDTATTGTTQISFGSQTQVLSIGTSDQANENVLLANPAPATVNITASAAPTTTVTPASTSSATTNAAPVCSSLVIDRAATGTAPYPVTFTAAGTDSDGTINKVSFVFGDGQVGDVTTGGGIGTKTVNAQISHTYQNAGTFKATATLTDNNGLTNTNACTTTVTVNTSTGGTSGTSGTGGAATATPTSIAVATTTPRATIAPTGPGNKVLGLGTVGIILTIIGGLILFGL